VNPTVSSLHPETFHPASARPWAAACRHSCPVFAAAIAGLAFFDPASFARPVSSRLAASVDPVWIAIDSVATDFASADSVVAAAGFAVVVVAASAIHPAFST